jgi:RHS repeat-associated protein
LQWSADNQLEEVKQGTAVLEESLYLNDQRWKKLEAGVVTYYLPGLRIEGGQARTFYRGFAERRPEDGGKLRLYHSDHLGSTSRVTRAEDGQVVYEAAYLPYGQTRSECSGGFANCTASYAPKYRFNFKELDAAGYYDYGARRYDPQTGRFLSADSVTTDGYNRYAYTSNNPLKYVDPTGHASLWQAVKDYVAGALHAFAAPETTPLERLYWRAIGAGESANFQDQYAAWHAAKFEEGSTAFKAGALTGPLIISGAAAYAGSKIDGIFKGDRGNPPEQPTERPAGTPAPVIRMPGNRNAFGHDRGLIKKYFDAKGLDAKAQALANLQRDWNDYVNSQPPERARLLREVDAHLNWANQAAAERFSKSHDFDVHEGGRQGPRGPRDPDAPGPRLVP